MRRVCSSKFSNYEEVIKEAIREGYRDFKAQVRQEEKAGIGGRHTSVKRRELELKGKLRKSLDSFLLPLLMVQGLTYNVFVVKKGENGHKITVYAERETCCTLQLIWAVSFETKVVELNSLEQVAGLAVAKAIGVRGERGLEELDCAGKQKEVVRMLMDKQEEDVVVSTGGDGGDSDKVEEGGEMGSDCEDEMEEDILVEDILGLLVEVGVKAD